jgi:hypothetical protein
MLYAFYFSPNNKIQTKELIMREYTLTHLQNPHDAVGATVKIGMEGICVDHLVGKVGKITAVKKVSFPSIFEVTFEDGTKQGCMTRDFTVVVNLVDGKRYMLMTGEKVTIHEFRPMGRFYFNYSELCNDSNNDCTETLDPNGFAYHYDCGCNVLKEVN